MSREITNKLLELLEEGALSWETVARECLSYMSEDEVADMDNGARFIEEDDEVTE
jgi:hypothetical protein